MANIKKILIVTFSQGGPFIWAQNLAKHLNENGYETKVYHRKYYRHHIKEQFKYYDIVHSVIPMPYFFTKKYILTIHGDYKNENCKLAKAIYPLSVFKASAVTIPSQFLKNKLKIKKAKVISNAIDLPKNTKKSYELISENPKIGILTNFIFQQKAEGLINLAKIIREISPESELIIGGLGELFEEYKEKVSKILKNVKFLGHCKKEDLFAQIDIFAYYSHLDNQPIAILEAMAAGLPVIINEVGAVNEIFNGTLEKYLAKTEEDYKKILKNLINSKKEREKSGKEAIKKSREFSWDIIVKKFIEIYES